MIEAIQISTSIVLAGAAFVQVYFLYLAFKLAGNYLGEHESKLKLEEERQIVKEILYSLYHLDTIYQDVFLKKDYFFEWVNDELHLGSTNDMATMVYSAYQDKCNKHQEKIIYYTNILNYKKWILEKEIQVIIYAIENWTNAILELQNEYENLEKI